MADQSVVTTIGKALLREAVVQEFKASLRGRLVHPGDDDYDEARKVWNGNIDRRPALIAHCAGVSDVINCVNFTRANQLLVSVRCGGHSFAGTAVCDGGLVIDLSRMKSIRVDPVRRMARAEGGVTWGEFDREAQTFGLATTGGTVSDTGIGGLTLGGGHGWLGSKYGLVSDNLLSVDIVTADGRFLIASPTENADLFWAVRGGGGNFGVVTSFEYRLHPVGPVLAGLIVHPFEKAKEAMRFYCDFASSIPDELNTGAGLLTSPEGAPLFAIVACYNGPIEAGEKALRPLREFGPPLADQIRPMSYTQLQSMIDPLVPPRRQYYEKAHFIKDVSDDAIDILIDHFSAVTSPLSFIFFQQTGGAMQRGETAYGHRDAEYNLLFISEWLDPGESEIHVRWTRELWQALRPFATGGVYVNNIGREADDGADQIKAAYGSSYPRLVALKNKYDPTNLFRHNQNIKPTN